MNLLVLLLIALPMCLAQVTIVGPSDGNREAQGLTVEEGKGIHYTEQDDGQVGQSYIQGATSGPSSYAVQGAADSGQYSAYNPNEKSLNYNDNNGFKLNWRSYDRQQRVQQPEAQYSEAPVARAQPQRYRGHVHPQQQPQSQPRQQPRPQPQPQIQHQVEPLPPSVNINAAPAYLKDIVRYQDQLPFYNNFLIPVRYDSGAQGESQEQVTQQPRHPYRGKARVPSRQRRQAQHPRGRNNAPQPEPAGPPARYHNSLPAHFQQLLQAQAQIPYINGIPEQYRYNPDFSAQKQEIQSYFQNLKVNPQPPSVEPARQQYRPEPGPGHRQKRQAPHPQQQPQQASAEPQIHYSTNIPGHLRELLKLQAEIPNNIVPNQVPYNIDASFVPQPAQAPAPQQVQYPGQGNAYQGQPSGQAYVNQPQDQPEYQHQYQTQYQPQYQSQINQYQPGNQQPSNDVRPVTENQY